MAAVRGLAHATEAETLSLAERDGLGLAGVHLPSRAAGLAADETVILLTSPLHPY